MQEALSIPGIAIGHINIVRGASNTGKTTTSIEAAVSAQKWVYCLFLSLLK
jgi:KaiC/GvpD/RAD55 family RecA-like ATPase